MDTSWAEQIPGTWRERAPRVVSAAADLAAAGAGACEFRTFLCAIPDSPAFGDLPQKLGSDIRLVMRRILREELSKRWPDRRFEQDHGVAEAVVSVAVGTGDRVEVKVTPQTAYVAGRYRKLARGISQTVFHCRQCRGRGMRRRAPCERCEGSGRLCPESVEEFVCPPIRSALGGRSSGFHGAGREDVDVRMLGNGRPFVVSVSAPPRRSLDADAVAAAVKELSGGRVEVDALEFVTRHDVKRITAVHGAKTYRVRLASEGDLPEDAAERMAALAGTQLEQRTPTRVADRRSDMVRRRGVLALSVLDVADRSVVFDLRTDPGLYVKEFVSGDGGRTTPSLAAVLDVPCECAELDVVSIDAIET